MIRMIIFLISSAFSEIVGGFESFSQTATVGLGMEGLSVAIVDGTTLMGEKGSAKNALFSTMQREAMVNLINPLGLTRPYQDTQRGLKFISPVIFAGLKTLRKN